MALSRHAEGDVAPPEGEAKGEWASAGVPLRGPGCEMAWSCRVPFFRRGGVSVSVGEVRPSRPLSALPLRLALPPPPTPAQLAPRHSPNPAQHYHGRFDVHALRQAVRRLSRRAACGRARGRGVAQDLAAGEHPAGPSQGRDARRLWLRPAGLGPVPRQVRTKCAVLARDSFPRRPIQSARELKRDVRRA
eukprot:363060-Chlamydomonas_euryale.AAC.7